MFVPTYMDCRYVIWYHLISDTPEGRKILNQRLKEDANYFNEYEEFKKWVKLMIELGEVDGEEFPEDFKELFI